MRRMRWAAKWVAFGTIFLALLVVAMSIDWTGRPTSALLPTLAEVESIDVNLWGEDIGLPDRFTCRLPKKYHGFVIGCLTPFEPSMFAGEMVKGLPALGELRILEKNGRLRRIVFVEAGKNPLCFTLDGIAYLRGGRDYPSYRRDHLILYGVDSQAIDESLVFARKLIEYCRSEPVPLASTSG